jgi:hypothetical protein
VGFRLEGRDEINDVGMVAETIVAVELHQVIVARVLWLGCIRRGLQQALDSHEATRLVVLCEEDHAKGPVVEGCKGLETAVE